MVSKRTLTGVMLLAGGLAFARAAGAQASPAGSEAVAMAEQLFRDAKTLFEQGNVVHACPKFAESQRLDPQLGTLINLALCHEREGKMASAWGEFTEVVERATRSHEPERVEFAKQHLAAVEPKLSRVALQVTHPPEGFQLKVDTRVLGEGAWGSLIPIDPGPHAVEATAPGKKPFKQTLNVAPGPSSAELVIPTLEDDPNAKPVDRTMQRNVGFVLAGVGGAALVAGVVTGIVYLGKRGDYNDCDVQQGSERPCSWTSEEDGDKRSSAETFGWVSTASIGVGVVGVAAGTILILTSRTSESRPPATGKVRLAPVVGARGGGLSLGGVF
jgi:hypothetical protein